MTEQDNFEVWMAEFLEIDKESLEQCRYTDEDGELGYSGLDAYGFTKEADSIAIMGIQTWFSAIKSRKSVGIITSIDPLRFSVNVVYKPDTNGTIPNTIKIGQEVYQ
jgi:hypothetical protein